MSYKKSPFENAPKKNVNKTRFNLSHEHKSQMQLGMIFPCMRPIEVMPGDNIEIQSQYFFRFEALFYPIMHKVTMRADAYYFPYRILWPKGTGTNVGWMDWLSKMETSEHPYMNARMVFRDDQFNTNVLAFMGVPMIPAGTAPDPPVGYDSLIFRLNAFPLSAYLMLWDWYERNPQLEDEIWFPLKDGDNTALFDTAFGVASGFSWGILGSKWEKDMFTSALPTPQVGDAITIPIADPNDPRTGWVDATLGTPVTGPVLGATEPVSGLPKSQIGATDVILDVTATIKNLREAEVLQSFHERIMKIGDRYDDYIEGLYGNKPQPGIINIPVLIGSVFGKVNVSDVMSQTQTTGTTSSTIPKLGDYAGQANLYEEGQKMEYTCNEHGIILMVIQINANTGYGQGIDRMWRRSVQTDYPLDMFATIGDQEILKEEILYTGNTADRLAGRFQETFGYIDRFAEAKFMNDLYVAQLAFNVGFSQHLGRWWNPETITGATYSSTIEIGGGLMDGFITAMPGVPGGHRLVDVFRVLPASGGSAENLSVYPTQGTIFAWIFHSIYVNRSLPLYSTPRL